jgi:hypothetical protein
MDNRVIDHYTVELEALSEHEHCDLPVRCIATNTDDKSAAEAWLSLYNTRALVRFVYGDEHVNTWMQQLEGHHYADLIAQYRGSKAEHCIVNSADLLRFGFNHDELRPWRLEKAS